MGELGVIGLIEPIGLIGLIRPIGVIRPIGLPLLADSIANLQ